MRPKLINARNLERTAGVWGDASGCHGDVSTLTGPLTNLTGNLSALEGTVHEDLVGDASNLRENITGLYGRIPRGLRGDYTFKGHGGDVAALKIFDDLGGLDRFFTRPVQEEALIFAVCWLLREDEEEYDPYEFVQIVSLFNLQTLLIKMMPEIQTIDGVTIPDDMLKALTR